MKLTVGVMGSSTGVIDGQTRMKLVHLGRVIAERGCTLITGACPGLPQAAVEGARAAGGLVVGISPGLSRDEHVQKYASPIDGFDVLIYTGSGLMGREVENIHSSDMVVIAGGSSGTLGEFAIAYDEGRLIGVLTGSGGIADAVEEIVAMCAKPTGAVVLYDNDPARLTDRLLEYYRTEHYKRPNCFCEPVLHQYPSQQRCDMDVAVSLVKAYLELCGYFVLAELPVRAPDHGGYHDVTDLDVIAARFPHDQAALPRRIAGPLDLFLHADPDLQTFEAGIDVVVGEVKEGEARLNPALQRARTIAFALRRVGCCPENMVSAEAQSIARTGARTFAMPGGLACHLRLVAFGGHGYASEHGVLTISLGHCSDFIAERLREAHDVVAGVQFKDSVLGLLALQNKIARGVSSGGRR